MFDKKCKLVYNKKRCYVNKQKKGDFKAMENIKSEDLQEMTAEELVDLKVRLEERIEEVEDYLENYEKYEEDLDEEE